MHKGLNAFPLALVIPLSIHPPPLSVLSTFQSRKAHRVHVRDKDILKYLGIFIITTFTYMVAWTAINLDYIRFGYWGVGAHSDAPDVSMRVPAQIAMVVRPEPAWRDNVSSSDAIEYEGNLSSITQVRRFEVCRSMSWDIVVELCKCPG